jgi:phosphopantetheinyl transferase
VYPTDVLVRHDEHGAPCVDGWWCDRLTAAPRVSLSHTGEICLAAVTGPEDPVGVDHEELGRIQQPELIVGSFASEERTLVDGLSGVALDERVLRLWCAKEAAAKCLGVGLRGQPGAFRIMSADAGCENLRVEHEARSIEARVVRQGNRIIAVATCSTAAEVHG